MTLGAFSGRRNALQRHETLQITSRDVSWDFSNIKPCNDLKQHYSSHVDNTNNINNNNNKIDNTDYTDCTDSTEPPEGSAAVA